MKALYFHIGCAYFLSRFVLIDRQLKKAFFHKIVDFIHCLIVSSECGPPPSLPNANYSLENHTTAVYSCLPGFIPNNPNNAIQCKDFNWSSINLTCTCKLQFFFTIISWYQYLGGGGATVFTNLIISHLLNITVILHYLRIELESIILVNNASVENLYCFSPVMHLSPGGP